MRGEVASTIQYVMKKFEALTAGELYRILKLRQEVFIIEQTCIYSDIDGKDETAYHLMAFDGDSVVGCLRILGRGISFDAVSVGRVVVPARHRGRGIAKEMMGAALDFIRRELREKQIKLSAQTYATGFYEGLGFVRASEEYLEDDIPHVDMVCTLAEG